MTWAHIPASVSPISPQAVLAHNVAEKCQGRGDSSKAEEKPRPSSEAESQSQSADDNEESENASKGQTESAENRESGAGGGKAARPCLPAPRTMASPGASGR